MYFIPFSFFNNYNKAPSFPLGCDTENFKWSEVVCCGVCITLVELIIGSSGGKSKLDVARISLTLVTALTTKRPDSVDFELYEYLAYPSI